jgi:hypothetical protein
MRLVLVLAVAAALGLTACGAGDETAPAEATETSEPEQAALPDLARVVCAVHGTRLETDTVRPQPDGVHLEVVNETGEDRSISVLDPQGGGMGQSAPAGTSTLVVALAPGTLEVTCSDLREEELEGSMLEVVDEDGVWISTSLGCDEGFSSAGSYTEDARGEPDPLAAAHATLDPYAEPGDVVEPAGYPDALEPEYRLVRDGEILAVVELFDDGAGGWLQSSLTGCSTLTD